MNIYAKYYLYTKKHWIVSLCFSFGYILVLAQASVNLDGSGGFGGIQVINQNGIRVVQTFAFAEEHSFAEVGLYEQNGFRKCNLSSRFGSIYLSSNFSSARITAHHSLFGQIELYGISRSTDSFLPPPFLPMISLDNNTEDHIWNIGIRSENYGLDQVQTVFAFEYRDEIVAKVDRNGVYYTLSDLRVKSDIQGLPAVTSSVLAIQPSTYHMKKDRGKGKKQYGLISQNIKEYFPELVSEINNGTESTYMLNYSGLIPVMVKAIQERQELIEMRQAQIDALQKRIEALEAKEQ